MDNATTTVGLLNRAPILEEFMQSACSKMQCRGCNKDMLQATVCCEIDDDKNTARDKAAASQYKVHSICIECFDARVHMTRPGSIDKCRFCVEDKNAAPPELRACMPIGDPKKRRADNNAFNQLAADARKLIEQEEDIRRRERMQERAPIEAMRREKAQAARDRRADKEEDSAAQRAEAAAKEREEEARLQSERKREEEARVAEERAKAAERAMEDERHTRDAEMKRAKEAQAAAAKEAAAELKRAKEAQAAAAKEAAAAAEAAEDEKRRLEEVCNRVVEEKRLLEERAKELESKKSRKRPVDADVADVRKQKAKDAYQEKKAKLVEYDALKSENRDLKTKITQLLMLARGWVTSPEFEAHIQDILGKDDEDDEDDDDVDVVE